MTALRELRRAADVSQQEFSALIGVPLNTFRMWDSGLRPVPPHVLLRSQAAVTAHMRNAERLSLDQLAREFGVHERTLRAAARTGRLQVTFQVMYVFVVLEVGTRRILHWNVTAHPNAEWTAQQFRMIVVGDQPHRFVIHDRDAIYSEGVDRTLAAIGLTVLKTPVRTPQANAFCERLIGTIRRECLDFMIPLNEPHLRRILRRWVDHYNRGRPHARLGPGIPERPPLDEAIDDSEVIGCPMAIELPRRRSSVACITSIVSSERQREVPVNNICGLQPRQTGVREISTKSPGLLQFGGGLRTL